MQDSQPRVPGVEKAHFQLDHLFRMTDGTGMAQHSLYSAPDPHHGYCLDDNARALKFVVRAFRLTDDPALLAPAYTYLSFMRYAQRPDGRFHNFMGFHREWLDEGGSDDSFGRAIMGLAHTVALAPEPGLGNAARELLWNARPWVEGLQPPRSIAFALLGLAVLARTPVWESEWERLLVALVRRLASMYRETAQDDWRWFEDRLTYCNARLPHAMILASTVLGDPELGAMGLESLDFYLNRVFDNGVLDLVGHDGWYLRGGTKAAFDQQPVDAGATVEACLSAAQAAADPRYAFLARRAMEWYAGRNRLGLPLVDPVTGGCADGLRPDGLNENQGAESLLSYLNARAALMEFERGWL